MNDKEEFKTAVIECCINGAMTVKQAAERLNFSERYVKKLKARYRKKFSINPKEKKSSFMELPKYINLD